MSVKKKRTIGPCRGVTWLYYVVFLWSRDFFPPLYLDLRFRPLLLKCLSMIFDSSITQHQSSLMGKEQDRKSSVCYAVRGTKRGRL